MAKNFAPTTKWILCVGMVSLFVSAFDSEASHPSDPSRHSEFDKIPSLDGRVEKFLTIVNRMPGQHLNVELQGILKQLNQQLEVDIEKNLGSHNSTLNLFYSSSLDVNDDRDHLQDIYNHHKSEISLFRDYQYKRALVKYTNEPHEARILNDFHEINQEDFDRLGIDFISTFSEDKMLLDVSDWTRLLQLITNKKMKLPLYSAFVSLYFSQHAKIPQQIKSLVFDRFPELNFDKRTHGQKCILAGIIYRENYLLKDELVNVFEVTEKELYAFKDLVQAYSLGGLIAHRLDHSIIMQSGVQVNDFFDLPGINSRNFKFLLDLADRFTMDLSTHSEASVKTISTVIDKMQKGFNVAYKHGNIDAAIRWLYLQAEMAETKAAAQRKCKSLVTDTATQFEAIKSITGYGLLFYDDIVGDMLSALRLHPELSDKVLTYLMRNLPNFHKPLHSYGDTSKLVYELLNDAQSKRIHHELYLDLLLSLSAPKSIERNVTSFFQILLEQEHDYYLKWMNPESVLMAWQEMRSKNQKAGRDDRIRRFIGGYALKNKLKNPFLGRILSKAIIRAFNSFPSDLAPVTFVEYLAKYPQLALSHREVILKAYMNMYTYHVYDYINFSVIQTGHPYSPHYYLNQINKISNPYELPIVLSKMIQIIKQRPLEGYEVNRKNVMDEMMLSLERLRYNSYQFVNCQKILGNTSSLN